ncbi:MAG: glycoside hydrolase family 99-like domain-containing protein, partial [Gemmatimonadota bacterium]
MPDAPPRERRATVAIYCPLWHNYDHASSWKGEGWCEWELLRRAPARFPGHHQPLVPEWGCFDESDPAWSAREIDLAADHGIDVFLVDWYWYSGVRIMEEALERGLLRAPNRQRLRFALMWANHDWADYFPPAFGKPWNWLLPQRHSPADLERAMDYCAEHYFSRPEYWRLDGRLFFSLFVPDRFV